MYIQSWASQVALVVKNPPANAGQARNVDSIPGSGRFPGEETATHSSTLSWKSPWTEEPGGLQSMGRKESDTTERMFQFSLVTVVIISQYIQISNLYVVHLKLK